ncbi:hypothetical protein [Rubritalea tangerina]
MLIVCFVYVIDSIFLLNCPRMSSTEPGLQHPCHWKKLISFPFEKGRAM